MSRDALEGDKGTFIFLWWMFAIRAWAAFAFPSNDDFRAYPTLQGTQSCWMVNKGVLPRAHGSS